MQTFLASPSKQIDADSSRESCCLIARIPLSPTKACKDSSREKRKTLSTVIHRRSQGGPKEPCPPKFLENIVILFFERRFSKQNSLIRLKSNILPPPIFFAPPKIFGLATSLLWHAQMAFCHVNWISEIQSGVLKKLYSTLAKSCNANLWSFEKYLREIRVLSCERA